MQIALITRDGGELIRGIDLPDRPRAGDLIEARAGTFVFTDAKAKFAQRDIAGGTLSRADVRWILYLEVEPHITPDGVGK